MAPAVGTRVRDAAGLAHGAGGHSPAPRRARSAFLYFDEAVREQVKRELPELVFLALASEIGRRWKALDAEQLQPYEELAAADEERYQQEMEERTVKTPGLRIHGPHEKKGTVTRKPWLSAYFYFSKEVWGEVQAANPSKTTAEIIQLLGERWRRLPDDQRVKFHKISQGTDVPYLNRLNDRNNAKTGEAAFAVLTNEQLFREIVSWSAGWPALVVVRWREINEDRKVTETSKNEFMWGLVWRYDLRALELTRHIRDGHFVVRDITPAIEAADADAVRLALEFSEPAFVLLRRKYWTLAIEKFPGHTDVLEELDTFEPLDEADLCLSVRQTTVNNSFPDVVESERIVSTHWARTLANIDNVDLVEWLLSKFDATCLPPTLIHNAATRGNLELVQFLDTVVNKEIEPSTFDEVCRLAQQNKDSALNFMSVLRFLLENRVEQHSGELETMCFDAGDHDTLALIRRTRGLHFLEDFNIDAAASRGHLQTIKLVASTVRVTCTTDAMDVAAANGHLDVVEYLHATRAVGSTTAAMDDAASDGHLDVVRFLHKNRTEGCTPLAMNVAAGRGFIDVVQFLLQNRREGSAAEAMERAAQSCYRRVVDFPSQAHPSKVSAFVFPDAAAKHAEELRIAKVRQTLLYLLEHCTEMHPEFLELDALRCRDLDVLSVIQQTRGLQLLQSACGRRQFAAHSVPCRPRLRGLHDHGDGRCCGEGALGDREIPPRNAHGSLRDCGDGHGRERRSLGRGGVPRRTPP